MPQTFFLGESLNYYDYYADVEKISYFEDKTNQFFEKNVKFPKIQTGGNDLKLNLSEKQIERIKNIYQSDYILLKKNF